MPRIPFYVPQPTKDALNELGVKLVGINGSTMLEVQIVQGDKCFKRGHHYYYWFREHTFICDVHDSVLYKLEPWSQENLDAFREEFNKIPERFNW